jgi:hypothetical protein
MVRCIQQHFSGFHPTLNTQEQNHYVSTADSARDWISAFYQTQKNRHFHLKMGAQPAAET